MLANCPSCGLMFRVGTSHLHRNRAVICKSCFVEFQVDGVSKSYSSTLLGSSSSNAVFAEQDSTCSPLRDFDVDSDRGTITLRRVATGENGANSQALSLRSDNDLTAQKAERLRWTKPTDRQLCIASLMLFVLLLFQIGWFHGVQWLAHSPVLSRTILKHVESVGLPVPSVRLPAAIGLTKSASVSSHPKNPNALLVKLTFVNHAPVQQLYPTIELLLFDQFRRLVGHRKFRPDEYLRPGASERSVLASAIPVSVELELVAPKIAPDRFEFRFL